MPSLTNGWTPLAYRQFRLALGAYLAAHFASLIPWGAEVFSNEGVLPDAGVSPLMKLFPNVLLLSDSPDAVVALLVLGFSAALAFAVGWHDKAAALVVWYAWACLFGRNPLIANPSIPYVGWLLLAHLAVPSAGNASFGAGKAELWRMPPELFAAAWIVMSVAYTYSGYTKLISPSWADGSAFHAVLMNPLARTGMIRDTLLALPDAVLQAMTWGALAAELAFAPLALLKRIRPFLWLGLVLMHCGLLAIISFADLSLGMLLMHGFTFDPAWLAALRARRPS